MYVFTLKDSSGGEESYKVQVEFDRHGKQSIIYIRKLIAGVAKVRVLLDILFLHRYINYFIHTIMHGLSILLSLRNWLVVGTEQKFNCILVVCHTQAASEGGQTLILSLHCVSIKGNVYLVAVV